MSQTYTPPAPATSGAPSSLRAGLFAVWLVFTLGAMVYVTLVGTNAPYADEWEFVPVLLGAEPALPWLWEQHNEHRLPLPRLVYFALFQLTHDFRAGMLVQVVMLAALALWLMRVAAGLRGRAHWADAFFPASLLHTGHWENFVMGYQICFVLFPVLVMGIAVTALRINRANAFRSGVVVAVLLMLVALTGSWGVALVPPVAAWLAFVAVSMWRGGAKGKAALLLLLTAVPVAYVGLYVAEYHKPPAHPPLSYDPRAFGPVAGAVLALAPGIGLSPAWWAVCLGELVLGGWTIALLVRRGRGAALSSAGLIAVAAGVAGVALAIGLARAEWGVAHVLLFARYSLLMWPLLATTYLVWVKLGRSWVPIALCVLSALALPGNTGVGMYNGAVVKSDYSAIEADLAAGLTPEQITDESDPRRAFPRSHHGPQKDRAIRAIPMLKTAHIGIFAR